MDITDLFPWLVGAGTLVTILVVIVSILCSLIPVVAVVGGVFWFISKRGKQAKAVNQASLNWPSTSGTVTKSRVEVSGGDHATVSPRVEYEYEVGSTTYLGTRIRAGDQFMRVGTSRDAYDTIDRYPVGAAVTVYYDPANPAESALER